MGNTIVQNGGTTIYIKYINTVFSYSSDQIEWNTIFFWPVTITNSDPSLGILNVQFITDLIFTDPSQYFICGSNSIQFGTTHPTRQIVKIDSVSSYPGLFVSNGFDYISVFNTEVLSLNGSTLADNAGWICQSYFGSDASNNLLINCYSDGPINGYNSGGILGSHVSQNGTLTIKGCSSTGIITGYGSGGILSSQAGNVIISSCWSTGAIISQNSGGITGPGGNVTITNCYSTGLILGENSGGIVSSDVENAIITNCYSQGDISGNFSGGICGSISVQSVQCLIRNCYSLGTINGSHSAGGICGFKSVFGTLVLQNCYTTGQTSGNIGYMIGNSSVIPSTCYAESANNSSGWNTSHANLALTGINTIYIPIPIQINQPYELYGIGFTPYSATNISANEKSLIKTFNQTVLIGGSTTSGQIPNQSYEIISCTPASSSISIDSVTGEIYTTPSTQPGTYTMYIRNVYGGSYSFSRFVLLVMYRISPQRSRSFSISGPNRYVRLNPFLRRPGVFTNSVVCTTPVSAICYM